MHEHIVSNGRARPGTRASYAVLDTPPEERFDRITRLVARVLDVPVALITFIDSDRQFFISAFGLPEPVASLRETPLSHSFCRYVVDAEAPLVVENARQHPLVFDNPAIEDLGVASYLGVPIRVSTGEVIGSLCALDRQPRSWTGDDQVTLEDLAGIVGSELEAKRRARQAEEDAAQARRLEARFSNLIRNGSEAVVIIDAHGKRLYQSPSAGNLFGHDPEQTQGDSIFDFVHPEDAATVQSAFCRLRAEAESVTVEFRVQGGDGAWRWAESRATNLLEDASVQGIVVNTRDVTERKESEAQLHQREELLRTAAHIAQVLTTEPDAATAMRTALSLIGQAVQADRVYVFENHPGEGEALLASQRYEWCRDGIEPQIDNPYLQDQPVHALLGGWADALFAGNPVAAFVRSVPEPMRAILKAQGIRSILAVPIIAGEEWLGFIGVDDCGAERTWSASKRAVLSTIASTMGGFMHRRRFEHERAGHATEVAANEQRFRSLVEATALVVWRGDANGLITELGSAWERLTGQTTEELAGWGWTQALHPDDLQQVQTEWLEQIAAQRSYECEYRVRCADGVYRWVVCRAVPVFDEAGTLLEWVGTCTNIDEKKRATAALVESEERFRTLAETMPQLVWTAAPDGVVNYYNGRIEAFAGAKQDADGTWSWQMVLHDDDQASTSEAWERATRTGAPYEVEHRALLKDGSYHWFLSRGLPARNAEGTIVAWYGTTTDINDQKLAQEEMRRAKEEAEEVSRLKSSLLANMSHEIRTPLTTIIGFTDVLAEEVPEAHLEVVRMIQLGGHRLLDTLNSVLDLAKLESGALELTPARQDVARQVREVVEILGRKAREKGLTLEHVTPAESVWVETDRGALQRVLMNLVGNAIKFTHEGHVTIRVEHLPREEAARGAGMGVDEIVIAVEDTGIGMSEAFLPKVFEAFEQESSGLTRAHEGSGLGLAIVKQLVDLMGSRIEVESRKGLGSTFRFYLPSVGTARPASVAGAEAARAEDALPRRRVLLAEDRVEARVLVELMLRAEWHVEATATADEALAKAERARAAHAVYDVVLLDVNLGRGRSGIDVLHALREIPAYDQVPILALTAQAMPGDRERFLKVGFDGYVAKPFTKRQLQEALHQAEVAAT